MLNLRVVLLALMAASPALAQAVRVIPVPVVSNDATAPHAAYNGHATTFKAIAREGNGSYLVEWDFQGDGTFDTSRTTTNRYDLSERFTYPSVTSDTEYTAVVRVTSASQVALGAYRVHVFSDVPTDPNLATARQLQVMRAVAIDDALWFLHNRMTRSGNEADPLTGARATGSLSGPEPVLAEGDFLEALGRNGHFAAFPPAAYVGVMRDPAGNASRYERDPYAEDAFRVVNQLLTRLTVVSVGTNPGNTQAAPNDESNATGFYPEIVAVPIPGTDDGVGLFAEFSQLTGYQAAALRGLSSMRLGGYTAQVGDSNRVLGRPMPFIVQQMVDALVWAQNDGGSYPGSYYYQPNSNNDWLGEYNSGALPSAEALWWAEQTMASEGVIVPNIVKVKLASYLLLNARNCPAGGRGAVMFGGASNICDVALSAADTLVLGWLKGNQFQATDVLLAHPGYSTNVNPTRGSLRSFFDANQLFIGTVFLNTTPSSIGWDFGFVEGGDFSRTDGLYDLWTMNHWARAARAVEPEVVTFGVHQWERQFSRVIINNQSPVAGFTWGQGSLQNHNDAIVGPSGRASWAILAISPDEQRPIALVSASPSTAPEGSSVSFSSTALVHDAPAWSWSLGNGETRTGGAFSYAFPDDGTFTVTGTATPAQGAPSSHSTIVTVTNVAPVVSAGPDVTIAEGASVAFTGSFTDPGANDPHAASWQFGDGQTASTLAAVHGYRDDGVFIATLRVTDDDTFGTDTAQVTVTNVAPTITSTPPAVAISGRPLSYVLTFSDPGVDDVHTCSGAAPMGGSFTNCTLTWTPTAGQVGTLFPLSLCVSDDDSAQACQAFQLAVTPGAANQPPSAPVIDSPNGTQVSDLQPTLSVTNAVDPENDPLTYDFEVFQGFARVAFAVNVAAGTGTTGWQVNVMLTENERYTWRARAVSATGPSAWSDTGSFLVNVTNTAPVPPTVLSPSAGALIDTLTPTLAFLPWGDPDGDALTFQWQLGTDESFTTVLDMGSGTATQVTPATPLSEDGRFCWRVRADDGQAQSSWARACFRVSATDGAPSLPTLLAPADGAIVTSTQPVFAWTASVDPEGAVVTYELEVTEGGAAVASLDGLGGTAMVLAQPLVDGHTYSWRVRAKAGADSAFTAASSLTVSLPDAGTAAAGGGGGTTGGGEGTTGGGGGEQMPSGCGCSGLPGAELALLALALVGRVRRRRGASRDTMPPNG